MNDCRVFVVNRDRMLKEAGIGKIPFADGEGSEKGKERVNRRDRS